MFTFGLNVCRTEGPRSNVPGPQLSLHGPANPFRPTYSQFLSQQYRHNAPLAANIHPAHRA